MSATPERIEWLQAQLAGRVTEELFAGDPLTRRRRRCSVRPVRRLTIALVLAGAALLSPSAVAPALAQSCPNENFALLAVATEPFAEFLASKDKNGDGLVCRSREFVTPPPGYPTPFIVIDDLT